MNTESTSDTYTVGAGSPPVETEKASPFELKIGGPDGIDNADVPVRWCITPEFVVQMEKDGIKDPHILLVSYNPEAHHSTAEMQRLLVPVAELMTYLRFSKAGNMKIFGWIVDCGGDRKEMHKRFTTKQNGEYRTDVIQYDGKAEPDLEYTYIGTQRDILIPKDVFGSEPPKALKWFANLWHSDRLQDECHFRKRLVLAVTLKWVPVALFIAIQGIFRVLRATILSIGGFRANVVWKYVLRPFKYTTDMSICDNPKTNQTFNLGFGRWWKENTFLIKRKTKFDVTNHVFFQAFNPVVQILFAAIGILLADFTQPLEIVGTEVVIVMGQMTFWIGALLAITDAMFFICIYLSDHSPKIGEFFESLPMNKIMPAVVTGGMGYLLYVIWNTSGLTMLAFAVATLVGVGISYVVTRYLFENWLTLGYIDASRNDPTHIRELLCPKDGMNLMPTYALIPKEQRTIRLWFNKVKNKMCRPMQF